MSADNGVMPLDPRKIKARREKLDLTQAEVAAKAGMPQPHYARLESGGRADPKLSTAQKLAKALRCKVDDLLEKS